MKILFFGIKALPATGGADRVVEHLLRHLPAQHEYSVYLVRRPDRTPPSRPNVHFIWIPALPGKHLRPSSYFLLCSLHYLLFGHFDLVHAHNSDTGAFLGLLRLRPRTRIVGTFHGHAYQRKKWSAVARALLRASEFCFAAFSRELTTVAAVAPALPRPLRGKRVAAIPNGLDLEAASQAADVDFTALGVRKNDYLLFACGRLDPTKGLHHLLDAYARGACDRPLLVIGDFSHDRDYSRRVEEQCRSLIGVHLYQALLGHDALLEVVRQCTVFVFPSEVEAMSMMLLEVVSCRKLVVCSDIPANLAVVGPNYRYRFSLTRPGDLDNRLREAVRDGTPEDTMGPVYEKCAAQFSWGRIARQYEQLYLGARWTGGR